MQSFSAAHSNKFPFIPLIFLERQFPPCRRASHILCRMPQNSTLPFIFYLCNPIWLFTLFFSRKSDFSPCTLMKMFCAKKTQTVVVHLFWLIVSQLELQTEMHFCSRWSSWWCNSIMESNTESFPEQPSHSSCTTRSVKSLRVLTSFEPASCWQFRL